LYVNKEPIITNRNQAYFAELGTRGLQEVVLALFGRGLIHNGGLRKLKAFEKALGDS
jgi:hypothetical protein